jgi:hypothetical protein
VRERDAGVMVGEEGLRRTSATNFQVLNKRSHSRYNSGLAVRRTASVVVPLLFLVGSEGLKKIKK